MNLPLPNPSDSWLVIVDMQNIFVQQNQPWYSCAALPLVSNILELAKLWNDRTLLTRFVAGSHHEGSWNNYYNLDPYNKMADRPDDDPAFDIIDELKQLAHKNSDNVVTMTTFGKWGDQSNGLRAKIPEKYPKVVLTGVATECCVWSTAISAGESGAEVWLVKDGCAAGQGEPQKAVDGQNAVFTWVHPAFNYLINLTTKTELLGK